MHTWNIFARTYTLHSLPHVQNTVQSCIVACNYSEEKNTKVFHARYFSLVIQNAEVWHYIQCRWNIRYSLIPQPSWLEIALFLSGFVADTTTPEGVYFSCRAFKKPI